MTLAAVKTDESSDHQVMEVKERDETPLLFPSAHEAERLAEMVQTVAAEEQASHLAEKAVVAVKVEPWV